MGEQDLPRRGFQSQTACISDIVLDVRQRIAMAVRAAVFLKRAGPLVQDVHAQRELGARVLEPFKLQAEFLFVRSVDTKVEIVMLYIFFCFPVFFLPGVHFLYLRRPAAGLAVYVHEADEVDGARADEVVFFGRVDFVDRAGGVGEGWLLVPGRTVVVWEGGEARVGALDGFEV